MLQTIAILPGWVRYYNTAHFTLMVILLVIILAGAIYWGVYLSEGIPNKRLVYSIVVFTIVLALFALAPSLAYLLQNYSHLTTEVIL